jgi:hypothetical protein
MSRKIAWSEKKEECCPKACTSPGNRFVHGGDWIVYVDRDGNGCEHECIAKVIGVITWVEPDGLEDCRGWLVVYSIGALPIYGYERWVKPEDVRTVQDEAKVKEFLLSMFNQTPAQLFDRVRGGK